jgi:hypothetical protein
MECYEHGECGCEHICAMMLAPCELLGPEGEQVVFEDGENWVGQDAVPAMR